MPDRTTEFSAPIESHRLPGLDLGDEFIYPKYEDQSILNVPASLCQLLGIPPLKTPPLHPDILNPLGDGAQKVILILMDALGFQRLRNWMADDKAMIWNRLTADGLLVPLTSISPSTTCAAITTLWTASAPSEHGIAGYELWLKEFGVVANMIEHKPITYQGGSSGLKLAGFSPEAFLPVPPISEHFRENGVTPYSFQHYAIINSGLSQMFMAGAERQAFRTAADLWVSLRQVFEQSPKERKYAWVYWGAVDGLSHFFGPDDDRPKAEFTTFSMAFERFFVNELSAAAKKDTLVIMISDHGQILTDKTNTHYDLRNHPEFTSLLHLLPTGENRLSFLYVRPGKTEAVKAYIEQAWPGQFAILESSDAIEKGLFGPGKPYERLAERTGELVAIARGDAFWWWAAKENPIVGRHGGLSPDEMLVPFLAARL
ncbi:MAG: alkaline phosphatase family protein [Anaerolineales bacterium]|jgi:hypothetical protein